MFSIKKLDFWASLMVLPDQPHERERRKNRREESLAKAKEPRMMS